MIRLMTDIHRRLLLTERDALLPLLRRTPDEGFDRPTVCTGWSVRDVIAHCSSALVRVATGTEHRFTPEDNQRDVDERRPWPLADLLAELERAYALGAAADSVDGIALGEWVHGGDVREALGEPDAYASAGLPDALALVAERSVRRRVPPTEVDLVDAAAHGLDSAALRLGDPDAPPVGHLRTDAAGLLRIVGDRRPETAAGGLRGVPASALRLFS